ncbi:MAG: xanthine dehydrogenase [Proteobacteria bacterium]|nr:MAG: xanthine dehydrogenase [Pseudomonadota bacterium]
MREIVEEMRTQLAAGSGGALVTIVRTTGSVYRREGAKMLCLPGGRLVGSISGGCLESDVYEASQDVVAQQRPILAGYDTNSENDNVWGLGLGCNGTVEVLIEPLDWWRGAAGRALFDALSRHVEAGERCALVTAFGAGDGHPLPGIQRVLVDAHGAVVGEPASAFEEAELDAAVDLLVNERVRPSRKLRVGAREVFVDVIVPPTPLLVVGAGHDAAPLVRMARELGFVVTLIDSRERFATRERFPEADFALCVRPPDFASKVSFAGSPAVVLMTHNYLVDREILGQILVSDAPFTYVGALGPHARTESMLRELREEGLALREDKVAQIRTPIGIDIGAESPAEIALSVLAEVLSVRNGRRPVPLREKKGKIHLPEANVEKSS